MNKTCVSVRGGIAKWRFIRLIRTLITFTYKQMNLKSPDVVNYDSKGTISGFDDMEFQVIAN